MTMLIVDKKPRIKISVFHCFSSDWRDNEFNVKMTASLGMLFTGIGIPVDLYFYKAEREEIKVSFPVIFDDLRERINTLRNSLPREVSLSYVDPERGWGIRLR